MLRMEETVGSKHPVDDRCGARNRNGSFCLARPIRGRTRCRRHGGKAGRPITHGLYSKRQRELSALGMKRMKELEKDPGLLEMRRVVARSWCEIEKLPFDSPHEMLEAVAKSRFPGREDVGSGELLYADLIIRAEVHRIIVAHGRLQARAAHMALKADVIMNQVKPIFDEYAEMINALVRHYLTPENLASFKADARRIYGAGVGRLEESVDREGTGG